MSKYAQFEDSQESTVSILSRLDGVGINPHLFGAPIPINGIQVVVNPFLSKQFERKQVAFPKSKKVRIRKKWAKRSVNFKTVEVDNFYKIGNTIFVSKENFEILSRQFKDKSTSN